MYLAGEVTNESETSDRNPKGQVTLLASMQPSATRVTL